MNTDTRKRNWKQQTNLPGLIQRLLSFEFESQQHMAHAFGVGADTIVEWKKRAIAMDLIEPAAWEKALLFGKVRRALAA